MGSKEEDRLVQECEDKFLVCVYQGKKIVFDTCPRVRRCEKCKTLIFHESNCRWMTCFCGHAFCFVCGKANADCEKDPHYGACKIGYSR